jgi:hypothetical protein
MSAMESARPHGLVHIRKPAPGGEHGPLLARDKTGSAGKTFGNRHDWNTSAVFRAG